MAKQGDGWLSREMVGYKGDGWLRKGDGWLGKEDEWLSREICG